MVLFSVCLPLLRNLDRIAPELREVWRQHPLGNLSRASLGLRSRFLRGLLLTLAVTLSISWGPRAYAQHPSEGTQLTTEERLQTEAWWPTKSSFPLSAFAGSSACIGCHTDEVHARPSAMVRAATPAAEAHFLPPGKEVRFGSPDLLSFLTAGAKGGLTLTSPGAHGSTQNLDWVMGDGVLGRTFLYQSEGRWFQSELTYYTKEGALDVTTGLGHDPHTAVGTPGQVLTGDETRRCFACHTVHATTTAGFNPLHAEAGLGCEACHGPGHEHATGERKDAAAPSGSPLRTAIFNPGKLSPADSIDFCGSCHRTFSDALLATGGNTSTAVVRFQPYRLEESKCWRATEDERLTCVACHDPHRALERDPTVYDRHCVSCHHAGPGGGHAVQAAAVCPEAGSQCTTCHMPKVTVPSMHGNFTDHDIRIVRPGESMPS